MGRRRTILAVAAGGLAVAALLFLFWAGSDRGSGWEVHVSADPNGAERIFKSSHFDAEAEIRFVDPQRMATGAFEGALGAGSSFSIDLRAPVNSSADVRVRSDGMPDLTASCVVSAGEAEEFTGPLGRILVSAGGAGCAFAVFLEAAARNEGGSELTWSLQLPAGPITGSHPGGAAASFAARRSG